MMGSDHSEQESANIQAIADIVTDQDMFFSADIAPNGENFIYIVETPIDFSNESVGDIDPLLLDVNDAGDNDGVDDSKVDHDGVGDNANESNDDNISVSSEQSDASLASTVRSENYVQEFLEKFLEDIEE